MKATRRMPDDGEDHVRRVCPRSALPIPNSVMLEQCPTDPSERDTRGEEQRDEVADVSLAVPSRPVDVSGRNGFDDPEWDFQEEEDDELGDAQPPDIDLPPEGDHFDEVRETARAASGTSEATHPINHGARTNYQNDGVATQRQVRRRLNCKTTPREASAGPPVADGDEKGGGELVTRGAAAAPKAKYQRQLEEHRRSVKRARTAAWASIFHEPAHIASRSSEAEATDEDDEDGIGWGTHPSHNMAKPADADILFCRTCGAWSRGRRVRRLSEACVGKACNKGNLRLLEVGIAPVRGARLPPS